MALEKADLGWVALASYIIAYDVFAITTGRETLSSACWRSLKHPIVRWPTIVIATGLYKHLIMPNFIPQVDPLWYLAKAANKIRPKQTEQGVDNAYNKA